MDKDTFIAIVEQIVAGFEDPDFKERFAAAQQAGDVGAMMALPSAIQEAAFAAHGCKDSAEFKAAGRQYAADPSIAELLGRMKAALS